MKKLLLGLGTIVTVVTPITAVVACSSSSSLSAHDFTETNDYQNLMKRYNYLTNSHKLDDEKDNELYALSHKMLDASTYEEIKSLFEEFKELMVKYDPEPQPKIDEPKSEVNTDTGNSEPKHTTEQPTQAKEEFIPEGLRYKQHRPDSDYIRMTSSALEDLEDYSYEFLKEKGEDYFKGNLRASDGQHGTYFTYWSGGSNSHSVSMLWHEVLDYAHDKELEGAEELLKDLNDPDKREEASRLLRMYEAWPYRTEPWK